MFRNSPSYTYTAFPHSHSHFLFAPLQLSKQHNSSWVEKISGEYLPPTKLRLCVCRPMYTEKDSYAELN